MGKITYVKNDTAVTISFEKVDRDEMVEVFMGFFLGLSDDAQTIVLQEVRNIWAGKKKASPLSKAIAEAFKSGVQRSNLILPALYRKGG